MTIKFVNLKRQYIEDRKDILKSIDRVSKTGSFILGNDLEIFEKKFARYCKSKYALGLNSGSDAIFLTLYSLNLKEDDEIIVPAISFVATVWAAANINCKIIFCDVEENLNISLKDLKNKITKKTRIIIPVHLTGRVCEIDKIKKIVPKKILILEDAAQAFGSYYKDKPAGSFGFAAAFSLNPLKNLHVYGDGGVIVTNSKKIYESLKLIRNHGIKKNIAHKFGFNSRLDNIQAAIGNIKLSKIGKRISSSRKIADLYNKNLNELLKVPMYENYEKPVFHRYIVLCKSYNERKSIISYLKKNKIEANINYGVPLYNHPAFKKFKDKQLPTAEYVSKRMLSLPLYPEMKFAEIKKVIKVIKNFFKNKEIE